MKLSSKSRYFKTPKNQKGVALLALAFLVGITMTAFAVKYLSYGSWGIKRDVESTEALQEAKQAVIGNVLTGLSGGGLGQFPCDEDTSLIDLPTEGVERGVCNSSPVLGRFAWRSMSTGNLRDGNADKLWYVLSAGYRTTPVNSDTVPGLTVNGVANKAVAIFLSPGVALSSQSRPLPTATSPPVATNYLELDNSNGDNAFTIASHSNTFNDQALTLEPDDIYPLLEKRILKDFSAFLVTYKSTWGAFPFPATFGDPTVASFLGSSLNTGGFLPVYDNGVTTTWNTSTTPVPTITAPSGNAVSAPSCSFRSLNTRIRCDITITSYNAANPPTVRIDGIVSNIGLGFYDGLVVTNASDIQISTRSGTATVALASRTLTHSLDSTGIGTVSFQGTLVDTGIVRIEFRRAPPKTNWILASTNHYSKANNWHHLVYYKVAAPFLPGGGQLCGTCLTINRIDTNPNVVQTDVHALLVSAGRKLNATNLRPAPTYNAANPAQTRPSVALEDYFDSANNSLVGLIFDRVVSPLSAFNDQIEMVE